MGCTKVGVHTRFVVMHRLFRAMPRPLLPLRHRLLTMQRPCLAMRHPFVATRSECEDAGDEESLGHHAIYRVADPSRERVNECVGMRRLLLAMSRSFLCMLRPFVAMLHAFAAMQCEGVDVIHEESRGYHAIRRVSHLFGGRGSQCVGCSSEQETMRSAHV
jgi:hypothetical protein